MLVFRDGRQLVPGPPRYHELLAGLQRLSPSASTDAVLEWLLRAGELECALADAGSPAVTSVQPVTDALAEWLVNGTPVLPPLASTHCERVPQQLSFSRPEGFAYYALHPLDYADAAATLAGASNVAVMGIRSIGTTLAAVVRAAARHRMRAERISVRPHGHPFDRVLHFNPEEDAWVQGQLRLGSQFWIVDEGPGLSGSSFLAVGEALLRAGVSPDAITFFAAHEPDPSRLRTRDAAARWKRFRHLSVRQPWRRPADAGDFAGGGNWRLELPSGVPWPATWLPFERLKYLSRDHKSIFKFAGFGRYGKDVLDRARALHRSGFAPRAETAGQGFIAYEWIRGRAMQPEDVSAAVLQRIAHYCARRATEFVASSGTSLDAMLRTNLEEEFGPEAAAPGIPFECRRPVIVDGRMHPHEWLRMPFGQTIKLDAVDHGDDHFFPGPTDIAWDLAGAMVEWKLGREASNYLLSEYRRLSGDDPRPRLPAYLLTYSMFRLGFCRMAAESLRGSEEEARFLREAGHYRNFALQQLASAGASQQSGEELVGKAV